MATRSQRPWHSNTMLADRWHESRMQTTPNWSARESTCVPHSAARCARFADTSRSSRSRRECSCQSLPDINLPGDCSRDQCEAIFLQTLDGRVDSGDHGVNLGSLAIEKIGDSALFVNRRARQGDPAKPLTG